VNISKQINTALLVGLIGFATVSQGAEKGGTFNFVAPYDGSILSLDPHKTSKQQDLLVTYNIFRSLYQWSPSENKPVLELAAKVDVSNEGRTYTYTLKEGVYFHNNRQLVADDIIYSYQRMLSMKPVSPNVGHLQVIEGAKAFEKGEVEHVSGLKKISELQFSITLTKASNPAYYLYRPGTAIVPREAVEKAGDKFGLAPVGSGPFKFVNWVKGSEVKLTRFDKYYEAGKPYLDNVVFKIMQEGVSRDIAFRAKELDSILIEASQYAQYKTDERYAKSLVEVAEMFTRLVSLNPNYAPLANKKVRQAISYAIDEDLINRKFLKGKAYNPVGWLPSASEGFDKNAKGFGYDLAKAKALMKEAGYEQGFPLKILGTANKSYGVSVAEVLGQFLSKINIKLTTQQLEGGILYDKLLANDYQGIIWSFGSGADPVKALKRWHSKTENTSGNYVSYNNAEYDQLVDKAEVTSDAAERVKYLQAADQIFKEDAAVWIFNYNKAVLAVQPWVHGIQPVAIEAMYQDFADVWVDKSSPRANR